jgi:hypothetical protein
MGTNDNHDIDDGLTEEERAALLEGEEGEGSNNEAGNDNDEQGSEAGTGDNDNDGGENSGDANGEAGNGDGASAAGDSSAEGGANTEETPKPATEATTGAPILVVNAPEGAETKLAEIAESKKDLMSKFDEGDITTAEYQAQLDALNKQERDIEWGIEKAKLASEIEAQRQANEWNSTVNAFISENPRYSTAENPTMYQMLDLEVRRVAGTEEFKNRNDSAAGREILAKANENLAKALGFEAKPQEKQEKPAQQQIKKPDLPPNLANVPAADQSDTNGGKYAVLDRMASTDPIAYEEALMKLPEGERNAYLAS